MFNVIYCRCALRRFSRGRSEFAHRPMRAAILWFLLQLTDLIISAARDSQDRLLLGAVAFAFFWPAQHEPEGGPTHCDTIVQAEAPTRPIARGLAGPGLLAHVLVSKYATTCRYIVRQRSTPVKASISSVLHQ